MCPWLLSPGDAEETIRMFFALVRSPAVAMKKAPHCAGLFRGRVLGEEGASPLKKPFRETSYSNISRRP